MKYIDALLNRLTMYRLVVYGLLLLLGTSFVYAVVGVVHKQPLMLLISFVLLAGSSFATEYVYSKVWRRPFNSESWLITALILCLILEPPESVASGLLLVVAGVVAHASKYIIRWRGAHIVNPAAFAASVLSLASFWPASWWIGSAAMAPFVLLVGLPIVRKIRHIQIVLVFASVALVVQCIGFLIDGHIGGDVLRSAVVSSPLLFLGMIMLTEPATMPIGRYQQYIFAGGIGCLYALGLSIGPVHFYPEVVIVLGNVYAWIISRRSSVQLELAEVKKISDTIHVFEFIPDRRLVFQPGQYMQWTLPHVDFDGRGNRRMFTIASSPTESRMMLGVRFYPRPSMYKYAMSRLGLGDVMYASQLSGSFTLPRSVDEKLLFVAGGIGITPFRSMVKYIIDTDQSRDIVLVYVAAKHEDIVFMDVFEMAQRHGVKTLPIISDEDAQGPYQHGHISSALLRTLVPDIADRRVYISGPPSMVDDTKRYVRELGVASRAIKTDHFSGY